MDKHGRTFFPAAVLCIRVVVAVLLIGRISSVCATAQNSATPQQPANQDCATIKQDIQQLQDDLANLSAEMQNLTNALNSVNQDISRIQQDLKTATAAGGSIGGKIAGTGFEEERGQILDSLAKAMAIRKTLERQLEDDATMMLDIRDEIADLLTKLANCPPPSTTQPPKQEAPNQPPAPPTNPPPQKNKSVSYSGFTPAIDLRGFGGGSYINGNTPATAGFDGAVLFPLGNRVLIGPTAGFQWVGSSVVQTIGGGPPPSTFINTSAGFKEGSFGGQLGFQLSGWQLGIRGGASVVSSTITQAEGFCGPTGCTTSSSTTTHDTVTGPFVGGYISHSIFSHVGVFVEYDYQRLQHTPSGTTPGAGFDVHSNGIVGGLVLTFGRH